MIRILLQAIIFSMLFINAVAQFSDDFSSGVLHPEWTGDRGKFTVENQLLRLNDSDAGSAYLVRPSSRMSETQWDFWVRLAFNPSNNNHPLIYLASDNDNLNESLNGYFIRIGKDGTDNKKIYFYRQSGSEVVELMAGSQNLAAGTNNRIRVRVTRDNVGKWEIYADQSGGNMFFPQGEITDNTFTTTSYFGIKCNYTSTNSDRFYFDDFKIGDIIPDIEKPVVNYLVPVNTTTLDIHFSKALDKPSSETTTNYNVIGFGTPVVAQRRDDKPNVARLLFADEFVEKADYNIAIANVEDVFGNKMDDYSGTFHLYFPQKYDVVFNEIMPNPTPAIDLPPYKYIELHNTSNYQMNVEGWSFKSGSDSERDLPLGVIPPKGYLILVNDVDLQHFSHFDNVISSNLGIYFLTGSGRTLVLNDSNGELMHTISYTDKWYNDPSKDGGGWAIEQIDPYNFCGGINNWRASTDPRGGTPGETNSVDAENPDTTKPDLVRAGFEDSNIINLHFSESMDETTLMSVGDYSINNGIGNPVEVIPAAPAFKKVKLLLENPLQSGVIYTVTVAETFADCAGNTLNNRTANVAVPQPAEKMDVVINEVLFNAPTNVPRYIELYNNSQKVIDLSKYRISSKDTINNLLTGIREISSSSYLMFPESYLVLTTNPRAVKDHYPYHAPNAFVEIETMSSMTNADGIIVFSHQSQKIIDELVYDENMHYALLTDKKGVALERLNPKRPTQDESNWHSAAETVGFGTPGLKNSQFTLDLISQDDAIVVYPEIFSPDNTGHDDVLNIAYFFEEPGFTANITIFDSRGRPVRTLVRSKLLGTKGVIIWDGTTDENQKANIGIYIVHVEVFDTKGNVKHYKKPAVLAGRL